MALTIEPGGVLGSTGGSSGCRQRVEVHPLVKTDGAKTQLPILTTHWLHKSATSFPRLRLSAWEWALLDGLDRRAARTR